MEPNEVPVIHSLFNTRLFRPTLSTHILGIIQAVSDFQERRQTLMVDILGFSPEGQQARR